jgi:hypothetical protein
VKYYITGLSLLTSVLITAVPTVAQTSSSMFTKANSIKVAQVNPIYGCWRLTWSPVGIVHESRLRMNGYYGTMVTNYYNQRTSRSESVQQSMRLGSSTRGLVIIGTNPVYVGTSYRHPTYNADSFFFQISPNGSYLFSVHDTAGITAPVEASAC